MGVQSMPVTDVCDADVSSRCQGVVAANAGTVRTCLADLIPKASPLDQVGAGHMMCGGLALHACPNFSTS